MNAKVKGYILASVAAATYGTNPLFALPLYADGMSADSVLFFRYLIAVPVIAVMIAVRGRSFAVERRKIPLILVMGILMAVSSLMLFESYRYMDAGIASTLLFVYPLMVAVIMSVFFSERLSAVTMLCIVMALGGIAMLFKGGGDATLSVTGALLVMLSSLSYSCYIVGVNRPGLNDIPTLTLIFYVLLAGVVMFGMKISVMSGGQFVGPHHWYMWGCVIALAVVPTVISFLCTTAAIQSIGPTPTAILGALEPVTAVIIGITVFGETLTLRDWTGLVLIIVSVSLVVAGGKLADPLVRIRKLFPNMRRMLRYKK